MRRIVGPNRLLGLLILALSLHAVCPTPDYNQRLELFNPTAASADVQKSSPVTPTDRPGLHLPRLAGSDQRTSLSRPQFRKAQIVHAAIPIYQKASPAADCSRIVEDQYAASLYSSSSVPRPSGRGPPRVIS